MRLSSVSTISIVLRWDSLPVRLQLPKEDGRYFLHSGTSFQVADHDFTRFSMIPSVALIVDIPDSISESWYTGDVHVG